jgi:zinc protease
MRDVGIKSPKGCRKPSLRGIEPKAQVRMIFSGPFTWSRENRHAMAALASVLRIKLRKRCGKKGVILWRGPGGF